MTRTPTSYPRISSRLINMGKLTESKTDLGKVPKSHKTNSLTTGEVPPKRLYLWVPTTYSLIFSYIRRCWMNSDEDVEKCAKKSPSFTLSLEYVKTPKTVLTHLICSECNGGVTPVISPLVQDWKHWLCCSSVFG